MEYNIRVYKPELKQEEGKINNLKGFATITFDDAFCTGRRSLHIIHPHQFHTGAGSIFPADALHDFSTRKLHGPHPRS